MGKVVRPSNALGDAKVVARIWALVEELEVVTAVGHRPARSGRIERTRSASVQRCYTIQNRHSIAS